MFTGLIQRVGTVAGVTPSEAGMSVVIDHGGWDRAFSPGESIAVSGCCLTLVAATGSTMRFDAIPETLDKTTLGGLADGARVNLEESLRADGLLGGHLVQGHVDGVGEVVSVETSDGWRVRLRPPAELMRAMAPKGSVTLDGVSLTLAEVSPQEGWIEVALIPETLERTTLRTWEAGARVNVEADVIAKAVAHQLQHFIS